MANRISLPYFSSRFAILQRQPAKLILPKSSIFQRPQSPTANFSTHYVSGSAPFEVLFFDQSVGVPTTWVWDFGDGIISSQQHPRHTYATAGVYTVTLTATNADGSNTVRKTRLITSQMVVDFEADPLTGNAPLAVTFTDLTSGNPVAWSWDFDGDSITDSTEQNPEHTYQAAGTYTVTLTASNTGATGTIAKSGLIVVSPGSDADGWPENDEFPLGFVTSDVPPWVVDTVEKHSGTASIRSQPSIIILGCLLRLNGSTRTIYLFEPNEKYTYYFWYKTIGDAQFHAGISIVPPSPLVENSTSWRKAHFNFTSHPSDPRTPSVVFYTERYATGTAWVDGFTIIKRNWTGEQDNTVLYDT